MLRGKCIALNGYFGGENVQNQYKTEKKYKQRIQAEKYNTVKIQAEKTNTIKISFFLKKKRNW